MSEEEQTSPKKAAPVKSPAEQAEARIQKLKAKRETLKGKAKTEAHLAVKEADGKKIPVRPRQAAKKSLRKVSRKLLRARKLAKAIG